MSAKQILFDQDARDAILRGVEILTKCVASTLGPKGRNVVIRRGQNNQHVTKDGVTVAREIELSDQFEDMGAQMVKEVASKTSEVAGDGTTSATVLAAAIYRDGARLVAAGHNPMALKRGIDMAVNTVVAEIKAISKPTNTQEEIAQVGTISANGDTTIGNIIAEAMQKVGKEGVISVEEAKGIETTLKVVEGMQFDRGWMSPYFVTLRDRRECVLENPLILVAEKPINKASELVAILKPAVEASRPILIICDEIEDAILETLAINHIHGKIKACAVKAPSFGDFRHSILQDIAKLTGATLIAASLDMKYESITPDMLGSAKRVVCGKEITTVIEGAGTKESIDAHVEQIRGEINTTESAYEREKHEARLARMIGGVAIISVGATTESELKEKKDRLDDALHATRAAVEEGVVPGGGVAYIRALDALSKLAGASVEEQCGIAIIQRAIEEPLRQITANAGVEGSVVVNAVKSGTGAYGYNAATDVYEDLIAAGVVDPAKVCRSALQNAASVAGLMLTTDAMIADEPVQEAISTTSDRPKNRVGSRAKG